MNSQASIRPIVISDVLGCHQVHSIENPIKVKLKLVYGKLVKLIGTTCKKMGKFLNNNIKFLL